MVLDNLMGMFIFLA